MSQHVIRTTHIQRLIKNALALAELVDGKTATQTYTAQGGYFEAPRAVVAIELPEGVRAEPTALPEHVLCKAISDLRHAADELDAERLSCYGWAQV